MCFFFHLRLYGKSYWFHIGQQWLHIFLEEPDLKKRRHLRIYRSYLNVFHVFSWKYSMFNITGHNSDHISKPSFYQYMLASNWEYVVFAQNVIIDIRLSIENLLGSSREGSDSKLSRTKVRTSFVGMLMNKLATMWVKIFI